MRSLRVVEYAAQLDEDLRFLECIEDFPVQAFIPELAIEAFSEVYVENAWRNAEAEI